MGRGQIQIGRGMEEQLRGGGVGKSITNVGIVKKYQREEGGGQGHMRGGGGQGHTRGGGSRGQEGGGSRGLMGGGEGLE